MKTGRKHSLLGIYKDFIPLNETIYSRNIAYQATCSECGTIVKGRKSDLMKTRLCRHPNGKAPSVKYSEITDKAIRQVFHGMVRRCYKEYDTSYRWYGAKGIRVCPEWLLSPHLFQVWMEEQLMETTGDSVWVKGLSIDRIDSDGNYKPSNCRIIPMRENAVTYSSPITVVFNGETITHTGCDWARALGLHRTRVNTIRAKYGEDVAKEFIIGQLSGSPITLPDYRTIKPLYKRKPRDTVYLTVNGITLSRVEWTKKLGLSKGRLSSIEFRFSREEVLKFIEDTLNGDPLRLPDKRVYNGRKVNNIQEYLAS